jgi:hypothetical protein
VPVQPDTQTSGSLQAGETFFTCLTAGSRIQVASGKVFISGPPAWLGGQLLCSRLTLLPGQLHIVPHQGWIALAAGDQRAAAFHLTVPEKASWLAACFAALSSIARRTAPLQMEPP